MKPIVFENIDDDDIFIVKVVKDPSMLQNFDDAYTRLQTCGEFSGYVLATALNLGEKACPFFENGAITASIDIGEGITEITEFRVIDIEYFGLKIRYAMLRSGGENPQHIALFLLDARNFDERVFDGIDFDNGLLFDRSKGKSSSLVADMLHGNFNKVFGFMGESSLKDLFEMASCRHLVLN